MNSLLSRVNERLHKINMLGAILLGIPILLYTILETKLRFLERTLINIVRALLAATYILASTLGGVFAYLLTTEHVTWHLWLECMVDITKCVFDMEWNDSIAVL